MKTWCKVGSPEYMSRTQERFNRKVRKTDECWYWIGTRVGAYGQISFNNRMILAHRVSAMLHGMEFSDADDILHKCDEPLCVNPIHLFVGDHAANMRDKAVKGRAPAKLKAAQVWHIRDRIAAGESCNRIAISLGVVPHTISDIKRCVTWKWLTKRNP